jgi:hypothetical protein
VFLLRLEIGRGFVFYDLRGIVIKKCGDWIWGFQIWKERNQGVEKEPAGGMCHGKLRAMALEIERRMRQAR